MVRVIISSTGFPIKDARFSNCKIFLIYSAMKRKVKQWTFYILVIGRLLGETQFIITVNYIFFKFRPAGIYKVLFINEKKMLNLIQISQAKKKDRQH